MTLTTLDVQRILLITLFISNEKSAPGEAGKFIYYRKFRIIIFQLYLGKNTSQRQFFATVLKKKMNY
jgi:hypothetical protein